MVEIDQQLQEIEKLKDIGNKFKKTKEILKTNRQSLQEMKKSNISLTADELDETILEIKDEIEHIHQTNGLYSDEFLARVLFNIHIQYITVCSENSKFNLVQIL